MPNEIVAIYKNLKLFIFQNVNFLAVFLFLV
jgi:hypothetical protein